MKNWDEPDAHLEGIMGITTAEIKLGTENITHTNTMTNISLKTDFLKNLLRYL
jgi:hypothetical protein